MDNSSHLCSWCGRENSQESQVCSFCGTLLGRDGASTERPHDKPVLTPLWKPRRGLLTLAGVIVLGACAAIALTTLGAHESVTAPSPISVDSTTEQTVSTTTQPATDTSVEIASPGAALAGFDETITFWNTSMTVSAPQILEDEAVQALAGDGLEIQVVFVAIVNASEVRDYNLFYWQATDEDGTSYDASLYLEHESLDSGEIQPGETVRGYVGFEIPKGYTVSTVTYSPLFADDTATWEKK
jgi:hypothetical protein